MANHPVGAVELGTDPLFSPAMLPSCFDAVPVIKAETLARVTMKATGAMESCFCVLPATLTGIPYRGCWGSFAHLTDGECLRHNSISFSFEPNCSNAENSGTYANDGPAYVIPIPKIHGVDGGTELPAIRLYFFMGLLQAGASRWSRY